LQAFLESTRVKRLSRHFVVECFLNSDVPEIRILKGIREDGSIQYLDCESRGLNNATVKWTQIRATKCNSTGEISYSSVSQLFLCFHSAFPWVCSTAMVIVSSSGITQTVTAHTCVKNSTCLHHKTRKEN